jgi:Protein of unknown function (DUF3684)
VDLTRYLILIKDILSTTEIESLQAAKVFVEEGSTMIHEPHQHRIGALYEPLDIHRQLGLPIIDWGFQVPWQATSEEGQNTSISC